MCCHRRILRSQSLDTVSTDANDSSSDTSCSVPQKATTKKAQSHADLDADQICSLLSGMWEGESIDPDGNATAWQATFVKCQQASDVHSVLDVAPPTCF